MNTTRRRCLVVLAMSGASAVGAEALTPRIKLADTRSLKVDLEAMIPSRFGDWEAESRASSGIVNPVSEATLKRIYSQILTRTYVDKSGHYLMMSIAYGEDQRKYLALHYPEVCYPAQGFSVKFNVEARTYVGDKVLPLRRLETFMGPNRHEPVTYWTTMGDYTSFGGIPRRMIELRYGIQRLIPDGLLFRVSSIGPDTNVQFEMQERFIQLLLQSVAPEVGQLLMGRFQQ